MTRRIVPNAQRRRLAVESTGAPAEELLALMRRETAKYAAVVKNAGIVVD